MQPRSRKRTSFTLIELLVVVAVIALLAALLLPTLQRAKLSAKRAIGMNNLRQAGLGVSMYRNDYNGNVPACTNWVSACLDLLIPYATSNVLYGWRNHEAAPDFYYKPIPNLVIGQVMCNINIMGGGTNVIRPITEVRSPNTTFLLTHGIAIATWSPTHLDQPFVPGATYNPPIGGSGLNFYFVDEHIEFIPFEGLLQSRWWDGHPGPASPWLYDGYKIYGP